MLLLPDAELVRRDACLPGFATLFDDQDALKALQAGFPELAITSARGVYVRYKPQTNCLVRYEVETAAGPRMCYAKAHRADATGKLNKACRTVTLPGHRAVLAEQFIVLHCFPDDYKLGALNVLQDDAHRRAFLQELLPGQAGLWNEASWQTIAYKPERRLVVRVEAENTQAAIKLYRDIDFARADSNATAFYAHPGVSTARLVGRSSSHHALALEWLPGRLLTDALTNAGSQSDVSMLAGVGAALANMHAGPAQGLSPRTRAMEAKRFDALADWFAWLLPDLASRVRALADTLGHLLLSAPPQTFPVHGDFYHSQVLLDASGLSLLDFDEAYRGDPAHDLGLFIAHLKRNALKGVFDAAFVELAITAFLDGYREVSGQLPPRISLYTAAELFGLAPHFFRQRAPDWPELTEAVITLAEEICP